MNVTVIFAESLQELMGCEGATVSLGEVATVADIWLQASGGKSMPTGISVLINEQPGDLNAELQGGDRIKFYL